MNTPEVERTWRSGYQVLHKVEAFDDSYNRCNFCREKNKVKPGIQKKKNVLQALRRLSEIAAKQSQDINPEAPGRVHVFEASGITGRSRTFSGSELASHNTSGCGSLCSHRISEASEQQCLKVGVTPRQRQNAAFAVNHTCVSRDKPARTSMPE